MSRKHQPCEFSFFNSSFCYFWRSWCVVYVRPLMCANKCVGIIRPWTCFKFLEYYNKVLWLVENIPNCFNKRSQVTCVFNQFHRMVKRFLSNIQYVYKYIYNNLSSKWVSYCLSEFRQHSTTHYTMQLNAFNDRTKFLFQIHNIVMVYTQCCGFCSV